MFVLEQPAKYAKLEQMKKVAVGTTVLIMCFCGFNWMYYTNEPMKVKLSLMHVKKLLIELSPITVYKQSFSNRWMGEWVIGRMNLNFLNMYR